MIKKYLPFILLAAAAFLLYWIKTHQRGPAPKTSTETYQSPSSRTSQGEANEPFDREIKNIHYSKHARCRMACRHIDESEVQEVLQKGVINYGKTEEDEKGKTYAIEGTTHDQQHVRLVVGPHEHELVVVTVIDLGKEWPCDCN